MTKNNAIITIIVVAIVVGALGFFGGMKYAQSKQPARSAAFGAGGQRGQLGSGATGRSGLGGQFLNGSVLSKDSNSLTIKLQNGSSKIIFFSGTTNISKSATGTPDDITVGRQISVTGSTNSDGSLTAQSIQIRPATSTPRLWITATTSTARFTAAKSTRPPPDGVKPEEDGFDMPLSYCIACNHARDFAHRR